MCFLVRCPICLESCDPYKTAQMTQVRWERGVGSWLDTQLTLGKHYRNRKLEKGQCGGNCPRKENGEEGKGNNWRRKIIIRLRRRRKIRKIAGEKVSGLGWGDKMRKIFAERKHLD